MSLAFLRSTSKPWLTVCLAVLGLVSGLVTLGLSRTGWRRSWLGYAGPPILDSSSHGAAILPCVGLSLQASWSVFSSWPFGHDAGRKHSLVRDDSSRRNDLLFSSLAALSRGRTFVG